MKYSIAGSGNVFWEEKGEVCVCVWGEGWLGGGVANRTYTLTTHSLKWKFFSE